jgi:hypothetical protein
MSEYYYRYNSNDATIDFDLENDEIYDYVLERENLKELDNVGPKCIRDFGGEHKEHFGNMRNLKGNNKSLLKNLFLIILVLIALYILYGLLSCNPKNELQPGKYIARFNY